MPTLDITDGRGELHPMAGAIITAAVLYPRDDRKRHAWEAAFQAHMIHAADDLEESEDDAHLEAENVPPCLDEHALAIRQSAALVDSLFQTDLGVIHLLDEAEIDLEIPEFQGEAADEIFEPVLDELEIEAALGLVDELQSLVSDLYRLRSSPKQTLQNGLNRLPVTHIIGEILVTLLRCAVNAPRHAKVEGAIWLQSNFFSDPANLGDSPAGVSEDNLKKAWPHYSGVAHLAHVMGIVAREHGEVLFFRNPEHKPHLEAVLGVSEFLRIRGEQAGFLDPAKTWKTPPDLVLPKLEVEIDPIDADDLAELDREFAERKRRWKTA